jgi:plasmid stabilization system protein ParE
LPKNFRDALLTIADNPDAGRARPDVHPDIRTYRITQRGRHVEAHPHLTLAILLR